MKKLLLILLLLPFFANAQYPDMWYSKKAAVEGIQFQATGSFFKPMRTAIYEWDETWYCHCEQCCCGTGTYYSIEFNTLIANPTIYPAIVDTTGKGYEFDECHYHFHSDLIEHTLYNINGEVVAGGAKMGYDWVSSGTFNPPVNTNIHDEITMIDPSWVFQSIPETLPQYGEFVISGMRDDLYPRDYDGNRIIIGRFINGSYVGVKDGFYRLVSTANFGNLGLNQGSNIYPDSWEIWIEIQNDTTVIFDVPAPPPPVTVPTDVQNVILDYKSNLSNPPVLTWDADSNVDSYEIQRWIRKGNVNEEISPVMVAGNSFTDSVNDLMSSALANPNIATDKGLKFYYKIRGVNSAGAGPWYTTNVEKL